MKSPSLYPIPAKDAVAAASRKIVYHQRKMNEAQAQFEERRARWKPRPFWTRVWDFIATGNSDQEPEWMPSDQDGPISWRMASEAVEYISHKSEVEKLADIAKSAQFSLDQDSNAIVYLQSSDVQRLT